MADKYQAVFAAIFMPTSVINLVAGFVIRPFITKLSLQWENRQLSAFRAVIGRLAAVIAALTVLALGGAWLLGIAIFIVGHVPTSRNAKSYTHAIPLSFLFGT